MACVRFLPASAAIAAVLVLGFRASALCDESNDVPPNIVVILADDLGYGDLGCYGNPNARTPHLDQFAREGLRFTDFHSNGPMCSPTRAALLTGRYQQRLGIETALPTRWDCRGLARPENRGEITVASRLGEAGYATGVFGKWHLGKHPAANPIHHGFDEFRGLSCGCGDYFTRLDRNGHADWWHNEQPATERGYTTSLITGHAVRFIQLHRDEPFFLYVAHLAIHFPWQTPDDGQLEVRRPGESFTSSDPGPRSKLGPHPPEKVGAVVSRMIEELDASVGRIVAALRASNLEGRTLVFFTSDNGGYLRYARHYREISSNGSLRGQKQDVYEGGHRVPAIAWWPGHIEPGAVTDATSLTMDLFPTFLALAGLEPPPADSPNRLDGTSLAPLLLRGDALPARTLFWRIRDRKAARRGPWKLVMASGRAAELYNLEADIGETRNLAADHPERVVELRSAVADWEQCVKDPRR